MSTPITRLLQAAAVVSLAAAGFACSDDSSNPTRPGTTLDDAQIPSTFTYPTNRPVALTVSASADAVAQGAAIEIAREDGRVLFKGPIRADRPVALDVVVPTKDRAVSVKLMGRDAVRASKVDIASGQASARFE